MVARCSIRGSPAQTLLGAMQPQIDSGPFQGTVSEIREGVLFSARRLRLLNEEQHRSGTAGVSSKGSVIPDCVNASQALVRDKSGRQ
jgi:hypothetical protein